MPRQTESDDASSRDRGAEAATLLEELESIRREMLESECAANSGVNGPRGESVKNLLHFLTLRKHDLRELQPRLARLGLSSLGRAEAHVLSSIDAVLDALRRLCTSELEKSEEPGDALSFGRGRALLREHADALLGPAVEGREGRIMVTMPTEAASDPTLILRLMKQGMDCMRINCAHDDRETWLQMIANMRSAEQTLGRPCRLMMDLSGPKLRTGDLEARPAVARLRPPRDDYGRAKRPARLWLSSEDCAKPDLVSADLSLQVPASWLETLGKGDKVRFLDARDAKRELLVVDRLDGGCLLESDKGSYIVPGTVLRHRRGAAIVGDVPDRPNSLALEAGDLLVLTADQRPGRPATRDSKGHVVAPATVACSLPQIFCDVQVGEPILFDDGKLAGVIEEVHGERVHVRITESLGTVQKLKAHKGINLPESKLSLRGLTEQDLQVLPFVVEHADVIELSFASSASDIRQLQEEITALGERRPGIVLKVETRRAFENLAAMLLQLMQWPSSGVMIARGDLGVECGFERLAEIQEEILWIAEAAHLPVIWATQVLESLSKEARWSRAEVTDAAMGHRAECVMLNKGPHVQTAVRVLDDIMRRMQGHLHKKSPMLRELNLAHSLASAEEEGARSAPSPKLSAEEEAQSEPAPAHSPAAPDIFSSYGEIDTLAGKGLHKRKGENRWQPRFEGGPATEAQLSVPHMTVADGKGNLYIADKEAHAIRKIDAEGVITTIAGSGRAGDDGDEPGPARERRLASPNGVWALQVGVIYILDVDNAKVRRVDEAGIMTTRFSVPGGVGKGRGLWVSEDESLAYVSAGSRLVRWQLEEGLSTLSAGFESLANLAVLPSGEILVTDRQAHLVYRVDPKTGLKTEVAGNGLSYGGGSGHPALETGLAQVRGVWPHPRGGFFVVTQAGGQLWYVDTAGIIHLFIDGDGNDAHAGDKQPFDTPGKKISRPRSITMDPRENLILTESDAGYVRIVRCRS